MKRIVMAAGIALSLLLAAGAAAGPGESGQSSSPSQTQRKQSWPVEPRWRGPGPMPRHYMTQLWGIPEPYRRMTNPLPLRAATFERGQAIYAANCQSCHGANGAGNGPAGRNLSPPPGNLVWLSDIERRLWDSYMYWTIAEGGEMLNTAMPPFKDKLTAEEIWAVTAYVQRNIPFDSRMR